MRGKDRLRRAMAVMLTIVLLFTSNGIVGVFAEDGAEDAVFEEAVSDTENTEAPENAQEATSDEHDGFSSSPEISEDTSQTDDMGFGDEEGIAADTQSEDAPQVTEPTETPPQQTAQAMVVTAADFQDGKSYLLYSIGESAIYLLVHHENQVSTVRADFAKLGSLESLKEIGSRLSLTETLSCEIYNPQSQAFETAEINYQELLWKGEVRETSYIIAAEGSTDSNQLYIGDGSLSLTADASVAVTTGATIAEIHVKNPADGNSLRLENQSYTAGSAPTELKLAMILADGEEYQPSQETVPEITETPEPTETPETPDTTETPETTETTEPPETTEIPENTEITDTPEITETPENTEIPETPDATENPEITETPDATETPVPTDPTEASDDTADVETAEIWESTLPTELSGTWAENLVAVAQSQLGYTESTANYRLQEDGTPKGYTRYGQWYEDPYGTWDAMFASFCITYAQIPSTAMPTNGNTEAWIGQLTEAGLYRDNLTYQPKAGDLVFLSGGDQETSTVSVAIVTATEQDEDGNVISLKAIQGDSSDMVAELAFDASSESIIGYAELPQESQSNDSEPDNSADSDADNNTDSDTDTDADTTAETDEDFYSDGGEQTAETENYIVTVTYGADAQIPIDAQLRVTEYDKDSKEYIKACEETGETYDWLLDISFYQSPESYAKAQAAQDAAKENASKKSEPVISAAESYTESTAFESADGTVETDSVENTDSVGNATSAENTASAAETASAESTASAAVPASAENTASTEATGSAENTASEADTASAENTNSTEDTASAANTASAEIIASTANPENASAEPESATFDSTAEIASTAETNSAAEVVSQESDGTEEAEAISDSDTPTQTEEISSTEQQTEEESETVTIAEDGWIEIEPKSSIQISVKIKDSDVTIDEDSEVKITHFAQDGTEVKEGEDIQIQEDEEERNEVSFELDSLSLVAGTTYHPATVTNYNGFVYGSYYLIYRVVENNVYFFANYNGNPATFVVPLTSFGQKGTGNVSSTYIATLNNTFYYTGSSIKGTINGTSVTLSWDDLLWYHNGNNGTIRNKNITGAYLNIGNGSLTYSSWKDLNKATGSTDNYTRLYQVLQETRYWWWYSYQVDVNYYLSFINNTFTGSSNESYADFTIAKVGTDYTQQDGGSSAASGILAPVYTGTVTKLPIGFYSVTADENKQLKGLAGVTYTIYAKNSDGTKGDVAGKLVTTEDMRIDFSLLQLPAGNYIMEMTKVPDGYVLSQDVWTFTLKGNDNSLSLYNTTTQKTEGIILINPESKLAMDKTASVENYSDRTYHVDLSAKSNLEQLQVDGLSVHFVVDQSNSMLFPSGLTTSSEGGSISLNSNGTVSLNGDGKLNKDKTYYFVADAKQTSTMYAVYYRSSDHVGWYYQDASYYAKAMYYEHKQDILYNASSNPKVKNGDGSYRTPGQKGKTDYVGNVTTTSETFQINGGMFGYKFSGSKMDVDKTNNITSYTLMEATDEYNRLHYLEQSMSEMVQMLAEINPNATVTLDTFTQSPTCKGNYSLSSDASINSLLSAIGNITTDGGTRQDLALQQTLTDHLQNGTPTKDYVILITDGAPVLSGKYHGVSGGVGTYPPQSSDGDTVYKRIITAADSVRSKATLATVGLGITDVPSGSACLKGIATGGEYGQWWSQPTDSSKLTSILCDQILKQIVLVKKTEVYDYETVKDYISDSFYPINPADNTPLTSGTKIDKNGNVISSSNIQTAYRAKGKKTWYNESAYKNRFNNSGTEIYWKSDSDIVKAEGYWSGNTFNQVGTVLQDSDGSWYVQWDNVNMDVNDMNAETGWTGRVYLKAKEDFIGGNAIATNKSATVTLHDSNEYSLETPTVNVRLLGMTQLSTDVTVYKGDDINGTACVTSNSKSLATPLDSLKYFYDNIRFRKLVTSSLDGRGDGTAQPVYNKKGATVASGCEAATFSIPYAIGSLSAEAWNTLLTQQTDENGDSVTDSDGDPVYSSYVVPYTYNSADGAVGYFTFQLAKKGSTNAETQPDGTTKTVTQTADFGSHTAVTAKGDKNSDESNWIEKYTLTVTYTAYKLGEYGRPSANVHNCHNNAGRAVGSNTDEQDATTGKKVEGFTGDTSHDNTQDNLLKEGYGTIVSTNVHKVYAIEGKIQIWKELTVASGMDRSFNFNLYKCEADYKLNGSSVIDSDGNLVKDANGKAVEYIQKDNKLYVLQATKSITVPSSKTGSTHSTVIGTDNSYMIEFAGLARGEYLVKEVLDSNYNIDDLTVVTGNDGTNCQYKTEGSGNDRVVYFTMGNNAGDGIPGDNVIGKANGAMYTSYIGTPNGVLGQAVFKNAPIPYSLPATGGTGKFSYTFGGWLLLAVSLMGGVGLWFRRERRFR